MASNEIDEQDLLASLYEPDEDDENDPSAMTLVEHLEELRALTAPFITGGESELPADVERGERRDFEVEVDRRLFKVRVSELRAPRQRTGDRRRIRTTESGSGGNEIVSPMHGTVVSAALEAGAEIAVGQTLFVIEAMKMENEIRAPRQGVVARVQVQVGETVESGQVLATLA